jgi:hypothetical protein
MVDFFASSVSRDAIALLDLAFQFIALSRDDIEVVVDQLAPLLFDLLSSFPRPGSSP